MAKNKKYVYLQLYPKDLLADEKLAKCDKASAWGAYLALLNIMSMEEIRGCVRLRDWDSHPNNERKSLVANFRKANSLRTKAAAFARVVSQCTPLKVGPMAEGIEQLLIFGVIVMHDDALIQPRMFRDSHSVLEGYEPEPEPAEETAENGADKGAPAPPKKEKNKEGVAPARTLRANTHTRFENESEYNNSNSIGNLGGAGGEESKVGENAQNDPDNGDGVQKGGFKREKNAETGNLSSDGRKREETPANGLHENGTGNSGGPSFSEFWEAYDKQVNMIEAEAYWGVLSRQDKEAIMEYIPRYKIAQPRKQFRKNPVTFLRMRAWLDEIITDTRTDTTNSNGRQQTTTTNQRGGYQGARRTQEQEAADGREQTMRIISRIFADQDAHHQQPADDSARGADTTGDTF